MPIVREYFPDDVWGVINEYARDKEPMRLCHEEMVNHDKAVINAIKLWGKEQIIQGNKFQMASVFVDRVIWMESDAALFEAMCGGNPSCVLDAYRYLMNNLGSCNLPGDYRHNVLFTPTGMVVKKRLLEMGFDGFMECVWRPLVERSVRVYCVRTSDGMDAFYLPRM